MWRLRGGGLLLGVLLAGLWSPAQAAIQCERNLLANVVALDQPLMFNRLGAQNVNGMMFALSRDVVDRNQVPLHRGGAATPGQVTLRPDKRPRPLVLRVAVGDCVTISLQNLLAPQANPNGSELEDELAGEQHVDAQVADRHVGFQVNGLQPVNGIADMATNAGRNGSALVAPGGTRSYTLYAEREGSFAVVSHGATFGSEGTSGNVGNGLFAQVVVVPRGGKTYRNTVSEEDMRLASTGRTPAGQPIVDYEARYPQREPWISEGKAGQPILAMIDNNEIVASNSDAIVMGPNPDGRFPPATYPLEMYGKRNPAVPNRLEPFRDFAVALHDQSAVTQAFPGYWADPVFGHVLEPTRDSFMINYGAGGIGAEVIANRLGVGPMHDCLSCAYEEFFLSSHTVGDAAMLVDVPANVGLENLRPGEAAPADAVGIKASMALFPDEPSNVNHSYIGDFVKIRNISMGYEQHVFHLHGHQWLFNPNDDNSDYMDAQGVGPGSGYTYEIANGGSGNRNRVAGDAIYHCHFYPHFAQGMWAMWRIHDVFEEGTRLAASANGADGFHEQPFGLRSGLPAADARALPDGEIVAGAPIPAIVPLPGKAMPPMPGKVTVVPKISTQLIAHEDDDDEEEGDDDHPSAEEVSKVIGSVALVDRSEANRNADGSLKNPGFPFWIGGIESTVGQRPPTPPLDMLDASKAQALRDSGKALWANLDPAQSGGWDGGLPRHSLDGWAAGGEAEVITSALDFSKTIHRAKAVYFPEEGTDVEQAAMAYHAQPSHPSYAVNPGGAVYAKDYITNGALPVAGAPYFEPCMDDRQKRLTQAAGLGAFNSGEIDGQSFTGASQFSADHPRVYKGANIQIDAVFNKVGYHFPQTRILTLWEDAWPVINKQQPPEPLVMRMNTFDCTMYHHTNLIPAFYEMDDYQVRTPTDVIGQHIHLPKWDLTAADGSANGWNYEDGVLSPVTVVERIHAIREYNHCLPGDPREGTEDCPQAKNHPYFGQFNRADWHGARTTMQRWFADPVVNVHGIDRGLGNIFTHDHFGPSTHQQIGLYATVLAEPAGSSWYHSETGAPLYGQRADGGPTSWQAVVTTGDNDEDGKNDSFREFFLEYSDFQHAYEAGVYVGAGPDGVPNPGAYPATADTFRYAINPPVRQNGSTLLESVVEVAGGQVPGCPSRPCPQAISVDDPGIFVVNYRSEPVGLRVFDPNKVAPDGKPGMQADGLAGDLSYALQSRTDRAIPALNLAPSAVTSATGPTGATTHFPPHINKAGDLPGDPFTPILRTYSGDNVRLRVNAGGHEEEHNVTLHGVKWAHTGTGFGVNSTSGWRASQMVGISEQLGFMAPVALMATSAADTGDYMYSMDASIEGYWTGLWGVMRNYTVTRPDLFAVPNNPRPVSARNATAFDGVCPRFSPNPNGIGTRATVQRNYEVVAALANDILGNPLNLTIGDPANPGGHVGGPLKPNGGTLVFNPRPVSVPQATIVDEEDGEVITIGGQTGPLHDPTAILYVRKSDLNPTTGKLKPGVPVEPLVLRAAAGDCINVTLENRLPLVMPDLPAYSVMQGMVKRDRFSALGSVTFNNNLMRPSSHVGLHAQLLSYDITKSDGFNVGSNMVQTVPPRAGSSGAYPSRVYQYYAGHLEREGKPVVQLGRNLDRIDAYPIEFGGLNLLPSDPIKQGQKGLAGAMSIAPAGATWVEDPGMRAAATVTAAGQPSYRDFSLVWHKSLNMRWADGRPVENMASEGPGIPNDPKDNSGMAVNYKSEPLWYRFGRAPNAPFGHAQGNGYADIPNAHMAYSNDLVGSDPVTPILRVKPGAPFRTHVLMPSGGSRGATFQMDGHVWALNPFQAEKSDAMGYPMKYAGVGSMRFGYNPLALYIGAQESVLPAAHFSFMHPSAGGRNAVPGDYLYRDYAAFGNLGGIWGLLRVSNEPDQTPSQ
ncbi:multicopper oxidase domain-containing protein [Pseudomonas sp. UL073]|uniref:Multicopper oxidase domain-containing protein n=1 Tax=Zestomonas insulae TaxID=2809017 RepID=A0ABS2I8U8_9GAMM|nr:multicopper oxidase domain-containing protein [Pseudomonas insulae]